MYSKYPIRTFMLRNTIRFYLKPKLKKITKKKEFSSTLPMNNYKSFLKKGQILADSNRTSINLSDTFSNLYLRLDDFPKNDVKVVVLFCLPLGNLS